MYLYYAGSSNTIKSHVYEKNQRDCTERVKYSAIPSFLHIYICQLQTVVMDLGTKLMWQVTFPEPAA